MFYKYFVSFFPILQGGCSIEYQQFVIIDSLDGTMDGGQGSYSNASFISSTRGGILFLFLKWIDVLL